MLDLDDLVCFQKYFRGVSEFEVTGDFVLKLLCECEADFWVVMKSVRHEKSGMNRYLFVFEECRGKQGGIRSH